MTLFRNLFGRAIFFLARTAVSWLPAIVLAVWAGAYLYSLSEFIQAPGLKLSYEYDTPQGRANISAEGWNLNLARKSVDVFRVKLTNSKGHRLAEADQLTATLDGKGTRLIIKQPWLKLHRTAKGSITLLESLPKIDGPKDEGWLEAVWEEARVDYQDDLGGQSIRSQFKIKDGKLHQAGARTLARGNAKFVGEAAIPFQLQATKNGDADIKVTLAEHNLLPAVPALLRWLPKDIAAPFQGLSGERLLASGPLKVRLNRDDWADWHGSLALETRRFSWPGVVIDATMTGQLDLDESIASFSALARRPGAELAATGVWSLPKNQGRFDLELSAASRKSLWPELGDRLPKDAEFNQLKWKGHVDWDGKNLEAIGDLTAGWVEVQANRLEKISAILAIQGNESFVDLRAAEHRGLNLAGWAKVDSKSKLAGSVIVKKGSLRKLLDAFGANEYDAEGDMKLHLFGTVSEPVADARFSGKAAWRQPGRAIPWLAEQLEARGKISAKKLDIASFQAQFLEGVVAGKGQIDLVQQTLDSDIQGQGLGLSALDPELKGAGFLTLSMNGSLKKPRLSGKLDIFGAEFQSRQVQVIGADFNGPLDALRIDFTGQSGSGRLAGQGDLNLLDQSIEASFTADGLQLHDWISEDTLGSLAIENGKIKGNLNSWQATAQFQGEGLVAGGVAIDAIQGTAEANAEAISASSWRITAGEGSVEGSAIWSTRDKAATADFDMKQFPLSRLPMSFETLRLRGDMFGPGRLTWNEKAGLQASVKARLAQLSLNDAQVGSGSLNLSIQGDEISGDGAIGSLDNFAQVESFRWDRKTDSLSGKADLFNLPVAGLEPLLGPSIKDWDFRTREAFASLKGSASGSMNLSGTSRQPAMTLDQFSVSNLSLLGRDAGSIKGRIQKTPDTWNFDGLNWTQSEASLLVKRGVVSNEGDLDLLFSLSGFDLSWITTWSPDLPLFTGLASATALVGGTADAPEIQASLQVEEGGIKSAPAADGTPGPGFSLTLLDLSDISYANELLKASGLARYQGLSGQVQAEIPLSSFGDRPDRRPMNAKLNFAERPLSDFGDYLAAFKSERIVGAASASTTISGFLDEFKISADLDIKAERFGWEGTAAELVDSTMNFKLRDQDVSVLAQGSGKAGGRFNLQATARQDDLFNRALKIIDGRLSFNDFLSQSRLSGQLQADKLSFNERIHLTEKPAPDPADGTIAGQVTGSINFAGDLRRPRLSGQLDVSGASVLLPADFGESKATAPAGYEPVFDNLRITTAPGSRIKFGLGQIEAGGTGLINGPLNSMTITAPLAVSGGFVRLPNARIKIDQGSTLNVLYRSGISGDPLRIDVSLLGETRITARKALDQYDSYEVNLEFRGNLLDAEGLRIRASSDPPDLTTNQILAILGQKQLFEALGGAFGRDRPSSLLDPLYQILLPNLTEGITGRLATSLRLDFLTLDYNPFDQYVVRAGKSLTEGLLLQASRQLSEPSSGRQKFELKLSYRLPVKDSILGRARLGFGIDQDRPWKITLDWARRF